jgi:hypothetical protein
MGSRGSNNWISEIISEKMLSVNKAIRRLNNYGIHNNPPFMQ